MKLNITGKNMEITDSLQERIQKKLGKLDKFLNESEEVNVRLSQEKLRNTVEITINLGGDILRVEETSNDMYNSIDGANDKIVRQIRRHRTKLEKRLRVNAFQDVPVEEEEENAELVRVNALPSSPCPWRMPLRRWKCWGTRSSCSSTPKPTPPVWSISARPETTVCSKASTRKMNIAGLPQTLCSAAALF